MGSLFDTLKSFFSSKVREDKKESGPSDPVELSRPFTLTDDCNGKDSLFREIMEKNLEGRDTPLKLMKYYTDILNTETSHGNIDEKLDLLFLCGKTPNFLDGYYHGITISLKTGIDCQDILD